MTVKTKKKEIIIDESWNKIMKTEMALLKKFSDIKYSDLNEKDFYKLMDAIFSAVISYKLSQVEFLMEKKAHLINEVDFKGVQAGMGEDKVSKMSLSKLFLSLEEEARILALDRLPKAMKNTFFSKMELEELAKSSTPSSPPDYIR